MSESREAWFGEISNRSKRGVVVVDSEGRVVYWNPSAERIFGYKKGEALGQYVHNLVVPEETKMFCTESFRIFQESGRPGIIRNAINLSAKRKNGEKICIKLELKETRNDDGSWFVIGYVDVLEDRSEISTYELPVQLSREERHELINALSAMIGFAELIRISGSEKDSAYAKSIIESAERIEKIINKTR